ncbi:MAG: hypothetical protein ACE5H1_01855 [Thermodesulfobacteriota bacterium]
MLQLWKELQEEASKAHIRGKVPQMWRVLHGCGMINVIFNFLGGPQADIVSNRYSWISTLAAVEALEKHGWIPVKASQDNVKEYIEKTDGQLIPNPYYGFQRHKIHFQNPNLEPIEVKAIGENIRMNKALWTIAEEMRKLENSTSTN